MKTGIYCRTSVEHEASIEQQIEIGIEFCKKNNFDFEVYKDEGISAYKTETDDDDKVNFENRPDFLRLINDIKSGDITQVWCFETSRLSRNELVTATIFNIFEKHNIELYEKNKKIDLTDPKYRFFRQILLAVNQLERDTILDRTKRGLHKLIDKGQRSFQAFYGYEKSGKDNSGKTIWETVDSELNVVKYTYKELLKGLNYRQILYNLYDNRSISLDEFKTLQRRLVQIVRRFEYTGYTWTHEGSQIYKKVLKGEITDISILNNPKYIVRSTPYPVKIISVDDWFKIFEKNIIRKRFVDGRKEVHIKTASKGLATGIIECNNCGFKYYSYSGKNTKNNSEYNYYKHHAAFLKKGYCSQTPKSFNAKTIDEIFKIFFFFNSIVFDNSTALIDETLFKIKQEMTAKNDKIKKYNEQINKNEKQLKKFNRIIDETDDLELLKFYPKRIQETEEKNILLEKEKQSLVIELERLDIKYSGTEKNKVYYNIKELVLNWFNKFNDEERRNHLIKFIKNCYAFGNYILIDTGAIIFLFDAKKIKYKFDISLLDDLDKDKVYKENFINYLERDRHINYPLRKKSSNNKNVFSDKIITFPLSNKNLKNQKKSTLEMTKEYFTKMLNINYDISTHTNVIYFFNLE